MRAAEDAHVTEAIPPRHSLRHALSPRDLTTRTPISIISSNSSEDALCTLKKKSLRATEPESVSEQHTRKILRTVLALPVNGGYVPVIMCQIL